MTVDEALCLGWLFTALSAGLAQIALLVVLLATALAHMMDGTLARSEQRAAWRAMLPLLAFPVVYAILAALAGALVRRTTSHPVAMVGIATYWLNAIVALRMMLRRGQPAVCFRAVPALLSLVLTWYLYVWVHRDVWFARWNWPM